MSWHKNISLSSIFSLLLLFSGACSDENFKVSGVVENPPADSFITLEKSDPNGRWFVLDSTKLSSSGKFSFSQPAPPAPEIIRLRLKGEYIYLPVDSTEKLSVHTSFPGFSTNYSVEGSKMASDLERFEKQLIAFSPSAENPDSLKAFKRRVYSEYLKGAEGSILSYYVLTKTLNGKPLYDNSTDYPYFAAVATAFRQYRPDDPRTPLLEAISLDGMRRHNAALGRQNVVHAPEIAIIDITLPDVNGNPLSLSEVVGKGRKTVLYFSDANSEETARLNMALRTLRDNKAIEIYHVSFDPDSHAWRMSASNLPWYSVWAGDPTASARIAADYNISSLPVFFIYDEQGQLSNRAANITELSGLL